MITDVPAAEETAAQYGVRPVIVPGVAHDCMLVRRSNIGLMLHIEPLYTLQCVLSLSCMEIC